MNTRTTHNIEVFEHSEILYKMAADLILDSAEISIRLRKKFIIALSGGNTPERLYSILSEPPFRDKIDWKNTFIFWGDERCVGIKDKRNNAYRAEILLLDKVPIPPENIYRIPVDLPPVEAAKAYEKKLLNFFTEEVGTGNPLCFDIILLGLGENGHTASLFPGTPVIHNKEQGISEVYVEEEKMYRITMTAPLINNARHVLFMVTGENKAQILEKVLNDTYQPDKYPAQLIMPAKGELTWFIDADAAKELE